MKEQLAQLLLLFKTPIRNSIKKTVLQAKLQGELGGVIKDTMKALSQEAHYGFGRGILSTPVAFLTSLFIGDKILLKAIDAVFDWLTEEKLLDILNQFTDEELRALNTEMARISALSAANPELQLMDLINQSEIIGNAMRKCAAIIVLEVGAMQDRVSDIAKGLMGPYDPRRYVVQHYVTYILNPQTVARLSEEFLKQSLNNLLTQALPIDFAEEVVLDEPPAAVDAQLKDKLEDSLATLCFAFKDSVIDSVVDTLAQEKNLANLLRRLHRQSLRTDVPLYPFKLNQSLAEFMFDREALQALGARLKILLTKEVFQSILHEALIDIEPQELNQIVAVLTSMISGQVIHLPFQTSPQTLMHCQKVLNRVIDNVAEQITEKLDAPKDLLKQLFPQHRLLKAGSRFYLYALFNKELVNLVKAQFKDMSARLFDHSFELIRLRIRTLKGLLHQCLVDKQLIAAKKEALLLAFNELMQAIAASRPQLENRLQMLNAEALRLEQEDVEDLDALAIVNSDIELCRELIELHDNRVPLREHVEQGNIFVYRALYYQLDELDKKISHYIERKEKALANPQNFVGFGMRMLYGIVAFFSSYRYNDLVEARINKRYAEEENKLSIARTLKEVTARTTHAVFSHSLKQAELEFDADVNMDKTHGCKDLESLQDKVDAATQALPIRVR